MFKVKRLFDGPIITKDTDPLIGDNINGPTIIRVPDWVEKPLGKYYLYFAHHIGKSIRLAYSDDLAGPWKLYQPGILHLEDFPYLEQGDEGHIASPEILIDEEEHRMILYYHGLLKGGSENSLNQKTYVAISGNGLDFVPNNEAIGGFYLRIFKYGGYYYSLEMFGQVRRSENGIDSFEEGPRLMQRWDMRHCGLLLKGDTLYVFHTIRGSAPESIVLSTVDLKGDWMDWKESDHELIMAPETDYEGGNLPEENSKMGAVMIPQKQLRDPYVFSDEGHLYLFYAAAGEDSIAAAELFEE